MDTRSPPGAVVSRDGLEERGEHVLVVDSLDELEVVPGGMVACDEAQFFGDGSLLRLWERVAAQQGALLVSGLDRDFRGRPFGDVLALSRLHLGAQERSPRWCRRDASLARGVRPRQGWSLGAVPP
ncbi:hypothetical protein FNF28_05481 [Cafeteria roenbergensis]|uniref:thymidine kinase n=1 Tax=Cafeteria roenbergensis TaxID=33653 RepID=A0A5A8D4J6_CAFRO|nr:hypothetical protein FNF28_05481 [Cafeteria roenbergensis]